MKTPRMYDQGYDKRRQICRNLIMLLAVALLLPGCLCKETGSGAGSWFGGIFSGAAGVTEQAVAGKDI